MLITITQFNIIIAVFSGTNILIKRVSKLILVLY